MYGQIHVCVQELVLEKFGQEAWDQILLKCGFDEKTDFMVFHKYTDEKTFALIGAVSEVAGAPLPAVLEIFGEYFLQYCMRHGYDKMLRTLGSDFVSFIQNLDSLHSLLAMSYKQISAPSFRCETLPNGEMVLHYYTIRPGLYPIVLGLVKAVAKELYHQNATIAVQSTSSKNIEGGKKQEHVIFKVTLDEISRRKSVVQRKRIMKYTNPTKYCEDILTIKASQFCTALPYHMIFDKRLRIKQCGIMIENFLLTEIKPGMEVCQLFEVIHPYMKFTIDNILTFINAIFMLAVKNSKRKLVLKGLYVRSTAEVIYGREKPRKEKPGQMIWLEDIEQMIFLCSPRLTSLNELMEMNVFLSDIPLYDVTRELVLLNQQRIAEIDIAKKLDETTAELKKTSEALEEEKQKTETLLYQMLPKKVANDLKNGRSVQAEKYASVTILFSDIVTFTNIAAACSPLQIVSMLNNLYQRFDKTTNQHDVYKVETIGDAYMIVSGVPETNDNHAEHVANFSIDMVREAGNINSPVTGKPIQIRVGFHSGAVVAGVVGLKMPRYCLFGDTVNTASRMESHGVPGRIHVSPTSFRHLRTKKYIMRERGIIDVKGKGKMDTYFLIGKNRTKMKEPDDEYIQLPLLSDDEHVKDFIADDSPLVLTDDIDNDWQNHVDERKENTSQNEQNNSTTAVCVML